MKRVLTTLVLLPIFIFIVVSKQIYYFAGLTFLGAILAQVEYFKIVEKIGIKTYKTISLLWTLSFLCVALWPKSLQLEIVISAGFLILVVVVIFSKMSMKEIFESVSMTLLGVFYIGFFLAYFIALKSQGDERGKDLLLLLTFTVWAGDTLAYIIGSWIGKHKLAPTISPKKSWEGAIANVLASVLAAYISSLTFIQRIELKDAIILGILISVVGQFGDLFESVLKRAAEIKDSSNILPGHGGILDRIDSLVLTAPILYYYHQVFLK
ncbi:MAG: phosphatidate cytidylyltransferase [Acidobacteria bacterium]|nr:phosphatidate cytidylyltransferase [Acidobacteriota bacterium]